MICPAATDTSLSVGALGLSAFSRFNRGTSLVNRRAEQGRPKTLVSGTPKVSVNRAAESATCRATCSRVFGTPKSRLLRQVHSDICTVSWELPRSDSTFVPTDSDLRSIARERSPYRIVSAREKVGRHEQEISDARRSRPSQRRCVLLVLPI